MLTLWKVAIPSLLWSLAAHAGSSDNMEQSCACEHVDFQTAGFLAYLYANGDYHGVRTMALRLEFENESVDAQATAIYWLGLSAAQRGDWGSAEEDARSIHKLGPQWATWSGVLKAEIWSIRDPQVGLRLFAQQQQLSLEPIAAQYSKRRQLDLLTEIGDLDGSYHLIERSYPAHAKSLYSTFEAVKKRRPVLAALLSALVPGAGQAYAGRWGEGGSALAVNTVFGWGMYSTIRNKQYPAATIIGLFAVGFYGGNIYGGADAAVRFNRAQRDHLQTIIDASIPLETVPGPCVSPSHDGS